MFFLIFLCFSHNHVLTARFARPGSLRSLAARSHDCQIPRLPDPTIARPPNRTDSLGSTGGRLLTHGRWRKRAQRRASEASRKDEEIY